MNSSGFIGSILEQSSKKPGSSARIPPVYTLTVSQPHAKIIWSSDNGHVEDLQLKTVKCLHPLPIVVQHQHAHVQQSHQGALSSNSRSIGGPPHNLSNARTVLPSGHGMELQWCLPRYPRASSCPLFAANTS